MVTYMYSAVYTLDKNYHVCFLIGACA